VELGHVTWRRSDGGYDRHTGIEIISLCGKEVPTRLQLFRAIRVLFLQLSCCGGEDVVGSKWLDASCSGLDCGLAHTACGGTSQWDEPERAGH
jgi:hypothetical protein